jgi:hypothetical protein
VGRAEHVQLIRRIVMVACAAAVTLVPLAQGAAPALGGSVVETKQEPSKLTACAKGAKPALTSRLANVRSETLAHGYCSYFWVASTDGTAASAAIAKVSWKQSLAVKAAAIRARAISIGRSSSALGHFSSGASIVGLGGVAVGGFSLVASHSASAHAPSHHGTGKASAPSAKISFRTLAGQIVLVLIGGQGTSSVKLSGLTAGRLGNLSFWAAGNRATVAAYSASPAGGTHTIVLQTTVPQTNSGTAMGAVVYVLGPH